MRFVYGLLQTDVFSGKHIKLKRSSCWPGGTEGQYEDRVVRQEDISMGINPALDYLSMPSSVEDRHDAVLAALALLDVHLLAVKIDVVPFEVACLKGAKAAAVDDREQRDGTLSIATSEIFFGICKARRGFTVWQRAMPAPICSNIHRINEVTNNRQQRLVGGFSFYAVVEICTT